MASGSISAIVKYSQIKNNLTTTAAGGVLDARQGKVLNDKFTPKKKTYTFSNLAQYSPGPYYLLISNVASKAGFSPTFIISASMTGWAGLGTNPNVTLTDSGQIYVFYTYNTSITSSSYVAVRFVYI